MNYSFGLIVEHFIKLVEDTTNTRLDRCDVCGNPLPRQANGKVGGWHIRGAHFCGQFCCWSKKGQELIAD